MVIRCNLYISISSSAFYTDLKIQSIPVAGFPLYKLPSMYFACSKITACAPWTLKEQYLPIYTHAVDTKQKHLLYQTQLKAVRRAVVPASKRIQKSSILVVTSAWQNKWLQKRTRHWTGTKTFCPWGKMRLFPAGRTVMCDGDRQRAAGLGGRTDGIVFIFGESMGGSLSWCFVQLNKW